MGDGNTNPFGDALNVRPKLLLGGGVGFLQLTNNIETAISIADAARFGYLLQLELVSDGGANGNCIFTLRDAVGGTILEVFSSPENVAPVGRRLIFQFPEPWKTAAKNGVFTLQCSFTPCLWSVSVNGFRSSI